MNGEPAGLEFLRPAWLAIAALCAATLALVGALALRRRRSALLAIVAERHLARFAPGVGGGRGVLRLCCAVVACAALGTALAGPVLGYVLRDVARRGLDVVVAVDTSRSMLVQDVSPSRLARAKREVKGLLDKLGGDRVALVAFAGDVRDVAPLTHDRRTVAAFVEGLDPLDSIVGGTNLGAAIDHALELFDGATGAHEAIVLLTDGEDLAGEAVAAAERAAARGIKLFIVGMGSSEGGKIPDGASGFVRDENGSEVVSALDAGSLARLTEITGGALLTTSQSALPLEELYEKRLSRLEAREVFAGKERIPLDRYQWFVALGAAAVALELALGARRVNVVGGAA